MKNISKARIAPLFRIIALVAVIGFSFAACSDGGGGGGGGSGGGGGGGGGSGTFTMTNIPAEYNGMYAVLFGPTNGQREFVGYQTITNGGLVTRCLISNGRVSIPMWEFDVDNDKGKRYSGNDTLTFAVYIYETSNGEYSIYNGVSGEVCIYHYVNIKFSNGGATKSCNDAILTERRNG